MSAVALQRKLSEIVDEYNEKYSAVDDAVSAFEAAGDRLKMASTIGGTWGETNINTGNIYDQTLKNSLLKSAWRHVYKGLNIETIAPASDKSKFEQAMASPPAFTMDNIRATFGNYLQDPMSNILRGLAEVFCTLDQSYKSHDKVKIGVSGLPKRVIMSNLGNTYGWGVDRLRDVLNALAAYQRRPLIEYQELQSILKDGEGEAAMLRGVRLVRFKNGNGHLFFDKNTLKDINKALAEYYGDVLADCHSEKPEDRQESTAVSKDLQYYPTPKDVVDTVLRDLGLKGKKVLEPSCGCGRFLDGIKENGGKGFGIEFDAGRAREARAKGHDVMTANFLEVSPNAIYDLVIMNPPFYGTHYEKHVKHALKFLKPGGKLVSILPATARYDHGLIDGRWYDLPVGSFRDSGTNINTCVVTIFKAEG